MKLYEYIPPKFEIGDLVLTSNHSFWIEQWKNKLSVITFVEWKKEHIYAKFEDGKISSGMFKYFKLVKKNCKLTKLII